MFKTMIALVVSMTATTALLGWIDPSDQPSPSAPTVEELLPAARDIASTGWRARRAHWDNIEIATKQAAVESGVWLAADSTPRDHHFSVDPSGRITCTFAWRSQEFVAGKGASLIVQLPVTGAGAMPTDAQVVAARALVTVLDEMPPLDGEPLPINSRLD